MPLESESPMQLHLETAALRARYETWVWDTDSADPDSWFGELVDMVHTVIRLADMLSDAAETPTRDYLLGRIIIARYAGAVASMRRGFDPRACPHCGGDHLDFGSDVEPGLECLSD